MRCGGDNEIEIDRWSTKNYRYGPAEVGDTLGGLQGRMKLS
jgi:hypothetical protein